MDEIRLKEVVGAVLGMPPGTVQDDTSTDTVEGWDSLKHMTLIVSLEEAFGITLPDEDIPNMTSYPIIRAVVREQLGG